MPIPLSVRLEDRTFSELGPTARGAALDRARERAPRPDLPRCDRADQDPARLAARADGWMSRCYLDGHPPTVTPSTSRSADQLNSAPIELPTAAGTKTPTDPLSRSGGMVMLSCRAPVNT